MHNSYFGLNFFISHLIKQLANYWKLLRDFVMRTLFRIIYEKKGVHGQFGLIAITNCVTHKTEQNWKNLLLRDAMNMFQIEIKTSFTNPIIKCHEQYNNNYNHEKVNIQVTCLLIRFLYGHPWTKTTTNTLQDGHDLLSRSRCEEILDIFHNINLVFSHDLELIGGS